MIELNNVKFKYPKEDYYININGAHKIKEGEFIIVSGDSGAGKSTLLLAIKGILPQYIPCEVEGEILCEGQNLLENYPQKLASKIIYIFQNPYSQIISSYVKEDILFTMENFNFSKDAMATQLGKFSSFFKLDKILESKTSTISGGECQKVVLASALAVNPKVLLLDEPTAFLDTSSREEFYKYLEKIKGQYTILMVDHNFKGENKNIEVDRYIHVQKKKISTNTHSSSDMQNIKTSLEVANRNTNNANTANIFELKLNNVQFKYKSAKGSQTLRSCLKSFIFKEKLSKCGGLLEVSRTNERNFDAENGLFKQLLIENINLKVVSGEIVVITGNNGVGKTTLIKLMSGVLKPTKGEVSLATKSKSYKGSAKDISILFQNPESHFLYNSIEEELCVTDPTLKENMQDYINYFFPEGLDITKTPYALSEGQKRRLSILQTVLLNKEIIFYDEPTFGQDEVNFNNIVEILKLLKRFNKMQIVVTHDYNLVKKVADRFFILTGSGLEYVQTF